MHRPRGYRVELRERAREALAHAVDLIVRRYDPEKIIVFGSYARGDLHEGSDLDLLIVKETEQRFTDRIGAVLKAGDYRYPIEPLVYTPAELEKMVAQGNKFIRAALVEGKVLYERPARDDHPALR